MKFCFWGDIAGAVKGTTIGGGELQMALLARALAKEGHIVIVVDPFSEDTFVTEEGIQVIHVPEWNKGIRILRIFSHRIPALYKIFVRQRADYYYVRMRSYFNLVSYFAARKVRAEFLLALASDLDILTHHEIFKFQYKANFKLFKYLTEWLPNDIVFKRLLKRADYVICQHMGQFAAIRNIRGKIIQFPNLIDCQSLPQGTQHLKDYLIYVGSLSKVKGVDKLYELVKDIDKNNLVIIVGQPNDDKSVIFFEEMGKLANVKLKGRLRHSEALQLLANARALINTSEHEGFPNVFLEAWAMGIPVLSLRVNPGNIFDTSNMGICFRDDINRMKQYINEKRSPQFDNKKVSSYLLENHEFKSAAIRFLRLLEK